MKANLYVSSEVSMQIVKRTLLIFSCESQEELEK